MLSLLALLAGRSEDSSHGKPPPPKQGALRRYIENFDRDTLNSMARLVSTEGASLIERQTAALFGDLQKLHQQMQVWGPLSSAWAVPGLQNTVLKEITRSWL